MDEARLIERLRLLEALHAGGATEGEKAAAGKARARILARLAETERADPATEVRFSLGDTWSRRLFNALLRRYEIDPYRYPRQRRTTVMARIPERFLDTVLWPQFQELDRTLTAYLDEVTDRVIAAALEQRAEEAEVREEPARLQEGGSQGAS